MGDAKEGAGKGIASKGLFSAKNIVQKLEKFLDSRNKKIVAIIFIIGILLMIVPGNADNKSEISQLDEEKRLCSILSQIQDCGDVDVMITYSEDNDYSRSELKVKGAIIVADGADDMQVSIKLSEAAQAVLDLPAHKVRVYKSQE